MPLFLSINNMRRLLILSFVFCLSLVAKAEDKSLFITFNDGSKAEFAMSQDPAISWGNDQMTVVVGSSTQTFELWRVSKFTFGTSTGIREVKGNIVKGDNLRVYTLDGKAVSVPVSQGEINLDGLSKGIYIININGNTIKLMKP